jgi:hypothetical protein
MAASLLFPLLQRLLLPEPAAVLDQEPTATPSRS